ncbi:MAG: Laccase domain protein YfiH [Syntrophorhabdus sp. PtaB.Bin184]|nr:MAG: Laccase domain protein YfiH [Syntrophorhabdus sp. PtaB.Bin184]
MDKGARKPVNYYINDVLQGRDGAVKEFVRESRNDWEYYHVPGLTKEGIVHGFFTRRSPAFPLKGHQAEAFLDAFSLSDMVALSQEHGTDIHVIGNGDRPVKGDGILLYKRGIAGVINTADCLCVILVDPGFPMVAIVHAGWRGTLKKIASRAVGMMTERGAATQRMLALMGPCIRGCCYEVGGEVGDAFLEAGFPGDILTSVNGSLHLDLAAANAHLIHGEGIHSICDTGLCTYCCDDDFVSYRRGARNARQMNFVAIRGG